MNGRNALALGLNILAVVVAVLIGASLWLAFLVVQKVGIVGGHKVLAAATAFLVFLSMGGISWGIITFELQRYTLIVPSSGVTLQGLNFGAYWDVTGTRQVTEVKWGTLSPGQTGNVSFYIRNQAGVPIYCATSWDDASWTPSTAKQYFDISWDFGESSLDVSRARKITLKLHVHADITSITDFSFNIILTASDQAFTG